MTRPIDADAFKEFVKEKCSYCTSFIGEEDVLAWIDKAPTIDLNELDLDIDYSIEYDKRPDGISNAKVTITRIKPSNLTDCQEKNDHSGEVTEMVDLISKANVLALINKAMFNTDNKDIQDYIFNGLRRDVHNLPSEVCGDCIWRVCNYNSVDWEKPTADRPKGEWIDKGEYAKCSICGAYSGTQFDGVEFIPFKAKFCSNCGAKMTPYKGGENE